MSEQDKQLKIDIPESVEGYTVTLFWGLTIKQIILVFIACLFVGFAIFSLASGNYMAVLGMLIMAGLSLLGMTSIRGRNFYRYILFIISYYKRKPRVLIYNHYSASGATEARTKQLVYHQENNNKLFIIISIAVCFGVVALVFIGIHISHVISK